MLIKPVGGLGSLASGNLTKRSLPKVSPTWLHRRRLLLFTQELLDRELLLAPAK